MKTFKNIVSEVAQPKSPEEKRFKDQHTVDVVNHPVAPESQFSGDIEGKPAKKKKPADYEKGADEKAYDQAYAVKDKTFKMPRNIDEESRKLSFKEMLAKMSSTNEEIQEDAHEELPMMMSQLGYISYAAEDIMEFLDHVGDPEEWYQNKLSGVFTEIQALHSYVVGQKRMMDFSYDYSDPYSDKFTDDYYEAVNAITEKLKASDEVGKWISDFVKSDDPKFAGKDKKERIKMALGAYYAAQRNEEVEQVDEAVKSGMLKLKSGDTVKVSDKDAKLLNSLLSGLNDKNRKEMEKVMMTDKNGFEEIVGFAREAQ